MHSFSRARLGDHAKYAHEYEAAGIPVWKPFLADSLRQTAQFGGFRVQSFGLIHNVPCCGFLIKHKDLGKMLYVTDTEYVPYTFKGLTAMLIEANYDDVDRNEAKRNHVLTGHLNIRTTIDCIKANASDALEAVVLCHLSEENSDAKAFAEAVREAVQPSVNVHIAEAGSVIGINEVPF